MAKAKAVKEPMASVAKVRREHKAMSQGRKIDGITRRLDKLEARAEASSSINAKHRNELDRHTDFIEKLWSRTRDAQAQDILVKSLERARDALGVIMGIECVCARLAPQSTLDSHVEVPGRGPHWPGCHVAVAAKGYSVG